MGKLSRKQVVACGLIALILVILATLWIVQKSPSVAARNPAASIPPILGTKQRQMNRDASAKTIAAPLAPEPKPDPDIRYFAEDPGQRYAVVNLADQFSALSKKAAARDLLAARTLFNALGVCERAPRDAADLQRLEEKSNDPNYRLSKFSERGRSYLASARSLYQHCGTLAAEERASRPKWTRQLAEYGDSQARLEFPYINQPRDVDALDYQERLAAFQDQAKAYLNAEIAAGNPLGLLAMANAYMPAVIEGQGVPFGVDPMSAYTYYYAYALTSNPELDTTNNLARLQNQLTPNQIEEATNRAKEIYGECCH